jgi:hypothetical protein
MAGMALLSAGTQPLLAQSNQPAGDERDRRAPSNEQQRDGDTQQWSSDDWNIGVDLDQTAWVRIAYDYDDDGEYDAFGYVYALDLEDLIQTTRQREDHERRRRMGQARSDRLSQQQQRSRSIRTKGELTNMKTIRLEGMRSPHLVGKLETDRGRTIRVDFGPKKRIRQQLDLSDGARVTVEGKRGHINDKRMLLAQRVRHDGQTFNVKRQKSERVRRFEGQVKSTHKAQLRGDREQKHVVAKVKLQDGEMRHVALGSQSEISQIDLQKGDRIDFLAKPARIDKRMGLVAKRISIDGEKHDVNQDLKRQGRGQRDREWRDNRNRDQSRRQSATDRGRQSRVGSSDQDRYADNGNYRNRDNDRRNERRSGDHQEYRSFSGKIASTENMKLRGNDNRHVVATINLENGKKRQVALGTRSTVDGIGISSGDRITFVAKPCSIDGKQGLVARTVWYDGEAHRVNADLRSKRQSSQQRNRFN